MTYFIHSPRTLLLQEIQHFLPEWLLSAGRHRRPPVHLLDGQRQRDAPVLRRASPPRGQDFLRPGR